MITNATTGPGTAAASTAGHPDPSERDLPYGSITPARRVLLAAHRIEVAAAEVRFTSTADLNKLDPLALRAAAHTAGLGITSVETSQRQDVSLTVTPHGPSGSSIVEQGWQLTTADKHVTITVFTDLLLVQHTRYTRFSHSLRPALEALMPVIGTQLAPQLIGRIGLRYVNRYIEPTATTPAAWRGKIAAGILGAIANSPFAEQITAAQQQLELTLDTGTGALIRHGAFRDPSVQGAYSYLVDLDVYNNNTDAYDTNHAVAVARRLNRTALALFQHIVEPEYRDTMQPYDPDNPAAPDPTTPEEGGR
jgi:uncharacterized protein (TIGR04255 family)